MEKSKSKSITVRAGETALEPLSKKEETKRQKLEIIVAQGLGTFVEVGEALQAIREEQLYRSTHGSFELYCRDLWGISKTHANRLIASYAVVENLKPLGAGPVSESQVRPLTRLKPEQQRKVWEAVMEETDAHSATGNLVTRIMHAVLPHSKPAPGGPGRPAKTEYVRRAQVLHAIDSWWQSHRGESSADTNSVVKELRELVRSLSVL